MNSYVLDNRQKKSFTLVELVVVTFIVSIFSFFLFSIYKGALDSWTKAEGNLQIYQNARIALNQISKELKTAFVDDANNIDFLGYNAPTTTRTNPTRSVADEIFFTGMLNPSSADAEICESGYWLDGNNTAGDNSDDVLRRFFITDSSPSFDYDYTTPNTLSSDNEMCFNIIDFQLEYWDDTIGTPAWVNTWDSTSGTQQDEIPKAVRITIDMRDRRNWETRSFQTKVTLR